MTTELPDDHSPEHAEVPLALKSNEGLGISAGTVLRYEVIDRRTGHEPPRKDYVVTPEGLVAWWDESQGWQEDENQARFLVRLIEAPTRQVATMCSHRRMVMSIRRDRRGNLFACVDCGLRTRDRAHWVDPDA